MRQAIQKASSTTIVKGSLADMARETNTALAETFLSADVIVLVDTSGSMGAADTLDGKTRYDTACNELAKLQSTLPGKIAVMSFSSTTMFCPNGQPFNLNGGTDLAGALKFTKIADVPDMRFMIISDGQPNEPDKALSIAKTYTNRIDVVYVGPEHDPQGRDFLNRLAKASGGQAVTADRVANLSNKVQLLLAA